METLHAGENRLDKSIARGCNQAQDFEVVEVFLKYKVHVLISFSLPALKSSFTY